MTNQIKKVRLVNLEKKEALIKDMKDLMSKWNIPGYMQEMDIDIIKYKDHDGHERPVVISKGYSKEKEIELRKLLHLFYDNIYGTGRQCLYYSEKVKKALSLTTDNKDFDIMTIVSISYLFNPYENELMRMSELMYILDNVILKYTTK